MKVRLGETMIDVPEPAPEFVALMETPAGQRLKAEIEKWLEVCWTQAAITELGVPADGFEKIAARDARLAPGLREAARLLRLRVEAIKAGK